MQIVEDPDFLIGPAVTFETGAVDGKQWEKPEVMEIILKMLPDLPFLRQLLVTFFQGAAETWKRFTSGFAPGGLIYEATAEEKDLAWMPSTNDAN
jgi:hypothetical protein